MSLTDYQPRQILMDPIQRNNDYDKHCENAAHGGHTRYPADGLRTAERWQKTGDIRDCLRSGCPVKGPEDQYHCIDKSLAINNELTAFELKDILIKRFGAEKVQYDVRTIARVRNELGWSFTSA